MNKWAIVTGGSSGLGLELARCLYGQGYNLVLVSRSEDKLLAASGDIAGGSGSGQPGSSAGAEPSGAPAILTFPCDLSLEGATRQLYDWVCGKGIVPDVLVNNAGAYIHEPLTEVSFERQQRLLNLNIAALTDLCRLFGERMASAPKRSHILNIASYSVYMPIAGFSLYASSKAYVRTFSKCLARELGPRGVKVTAVAPAGMDTSLMNLRPPVRRLAKAAGFLVRPSVIARISLRAMRVPCIHYWIPLFYNVAFIPFLGLFRPIFNKVL